MRVNGRFPRERALGVRLREEGGEHVVGVPVARIGALEGGAGVDVEEDEKGGEPLLHRKMTPPRGGLAARDRARGHGVDAEHSVEGIGHSHEVDALGLVVLERALDGFGAANAHHVDVLVFVDRDSERRGRHEVDDILQILGQRQGTIVVEELGHVRRGGVARHGVDDPRRRRTHVIRRLHRHAVHRPARKEKWRQRRVRERTSEETSSRSAGKGREGR